MKHHAPGPYFDNIFGLDIGEYYSRVHSDCSRPSGDGSRRDDPGHSRSAAAGTTEFTCILERSGKMSGATICYVFYIHRNV